MSLTDWVVLITVVLPLACFGVFYGVSALIRKIKPSPKPNILVVAIDGAIKYDFRESSDFRKLLYKLDAVREAQPKALIVVVNSPGGTVAASQAIYLTLKNLREQGIKVVALMADVAASGGLYVCMAADRIVAHPGTITGSIGAIIESYEVSSLLDRFQVGVQTIKSGEHKDIMSPTRKMNEKEKELLGEMVLDVYEQFCETIAGSRGLLLEEVKQIADGRVFDGKQAKDLGLVDELGGFEDAVQTAKELADISDGEEDLKYVKFQRSLSEIIASFNIKSLVSHFSGESNHFTMPFWRMPRF